MHDAGWAVWVAAWGLLQFVCGSGRLQCQNVTHDQRLPSGCLFLCLCLSDFLTASTYDSDSVSASVCMSVCLSALSSLSTHTYTNMHTSSHSRRLSNMLHPFLTPQYLEAAAQESIPIARKDYLCTCWKVISAGSYCFILLIFLHTYSLQSLCTDSPSSYFFRSYYLSAYYCLVLLDSYYPVESKSAGITLLQYFLVCHFSRSGRF